MTDGRRARDRIVAAQDHRQRAALGVHAVHRAEPARERLLLPRALAFELADLAPERGDVGLGPLDPDLEPRDLGLPDIAFLPPLGLGVLLLAGGLLGGLGGWLARAGRDA